MKFCLAYLALFLGFSQISFAQQTISIEKIPTTMEDFLTLRNQTANTPEGGAAIFVVAMLMFSQDEALGQQAFTVAGDQTLLKEDPNGYKGFAPNAGYDHNIKNYFAPKKEFLAHSYLLGTSHTNGYKMPSAPYKLEFTRNAYSEQPNKDIKVFIKCSGADTPRPITLRQNDKGLWKAVEYSSLFVGVRAPAKEDRL